MKFNRKSFFAGYRKAFGAVKQDQVNGLEFLLSAFEQDTTWKDIRHIAYALATIKHETANTFKPIKEYRARAGAKGRANQDRYWLSGYYGRGYVQITWKRNYEKFGIADTPEKALEPDTAFWILTAGMHRGLFTGKKLSDFIKGSTADYRSARKIINGLDKADLIAGYARSFETMLRESQSSAVASETSPSKGVPTESPTDTSANSTADHQPVETTVTRTEEGVTVEASRSNQQDVSESAKVVAPEPYLGLGFWKVIKRDFAAATGGNLSLSGLAEYAQQASGWPEWVVAIIQRIAVGVLIATIGYFVFRVVHYLVDTYKKNQKVKVEVSAATDVNRKDVEWI